MLTSTEHGINYANAIAGILTCVNMIDFENKNRFNFSAFKFI